jgi:hypothetical protein
MVYRRETAPAWRTQSPAAAKIVVGTQVADGRQELQSNLSKELAGFMTEQRLAIEANQQAIAALFQAVDRLNTKSGDSPPSSETGGDTRLGSK